MFDRMLWQDNVRDPARTYKATQNADVIGNFVSIT